MRVDVRLAVVLASTMLTSASAAMHAAAEEPAAAPNPAASAPARITVTIVGSVRNPGPHTLDAGARLSDALAAAGMTTIDAINARLGITPDANGCTSGGADRHRVFLARSDESSRTRAYSIDIALARQGKDLRYDPLLRENDKIFVPECRPFRTPVLVPPTFPRPTT